MMRQPRFAHLAMALIITLVVPSLAAAQNANTGRLFVNLTDDALPRATMAVTLATRVLKETERPVTLFLNVEAVHLANRKLPETIAPNGKSLKAMLGAFIDAGGRVIICPMCMKTIGGMGPEDLIDGVVLGGPEVTWPDLFGTDTTVLSY